MTRTRTNNILKKFRTGEKALGVNLTFPSWQIVDIVGLTGLFDFINLDGEHGTFSPEEIDIACSIADGHNLTVTARVADISNFAINTYLDRGVMGILGPHINTAAAAKQLVDACRFVPEGQRSWGGGRGTYYNDDGLLESPNLNREEFIKSSNKEMLVMAQLETATAFDNLDSILAVEGIDAFAWGSNDLAQSMGLPGQPLNPKVKGAEKTVEQNIHDAGRVMTFDMFSTAQVNSILLDGLRLFEENNH